MHRLDGAAEASVASSGPVTGATIRWLSAVVVVLVAAVGCRATAPVGEPPVPASSVARVSGVACGQLAVGGAVAVTPSMVVTNAHVVAGVSQLEVTVGGTGERFIGEVIDFDADRDLAAVVVSSPVFTPVEVGADPETTSARVVVVDADGTASGRTVGVRRTVVATVDDIYGVAPVRRRVVEIGGTVVAGESGTGVFAGTTLAGVVFAVSRGTEGTSYAVAPSEVADFVAEASRRGRAVGPCVGAPIDAADVDP